MRRVFFVTVIVVAFMLSGAAPVGAATIQFQATDLPDDVPGGDLWQYEYFLVGGNLLVTQGFAVFFDDTLYSTIQELLPAPGWDIVVADPIPATTSEGYYDALALGDNPLFIGPFSLSFIWLGAPGTPGSQPFEIYQQDASGLPEPFESGPTTPLDSAVPEPSTLLLLATGAAAGRILRKRRGQSRRSSNSPSLD